MWWLMVFAMLTCTGNVIGYFQNAEGPLLAGVMAAVMVVGATVYGYATDASLGYPIARGQYLQFVIVSVITAGVFTVFYLGGYYAGKRWPLRREQSVGYGKHSRQQKMTVDKRIPSCHGHTFRGPVWQSPIRRGVRRRAHRRHSQRNQRRKVCRRSLHVG